MPVGLLAFASLLLFAGPTTEIPDRLKTLDREYTRTVKIATSRWREGNFEAAFSLLGRAEELARKIEDREKETRVLMDMGKLAWALGQPDDSRGFYSRALEAAISLTLVQESEECRLALKVLELYNLGKADRLNGNIEKSLHNLTQAVEIARKIRSREHEVKCLRQLSLSQWAKQAQEAFLLSNIQASEIAEELADGKEKVKCLSNIGMYYFWRKDYAKMLDYYSQALGLARETRSREDESLCLNNISLILMHLGFYEKSADFLEASFELYPQSGNTYFFCQTLNNLGEAYRSKGLLLSRPSDLIRAIDYFHQAREPLSRGGDKKTELRILNNIGKTYLDLEKYHTARHYLEAALEISERTQDEEAQLQILANLGNCYLETGDYEPARKNFEQAVDLGQKIDSTRPLWELLFNLGQCAEKERDYDKAQALYENSLEAIDRTRVQILADDFKAGFMRNKFKVYESLIDLLFRLYEKEPTLGRAREIFYLVERAKARSFLETLGEVQVSPGKPIIASLPGEKNQNKTPSSGLPKETSAGTLEKSLPAPLRPEKIQESLLDEKTAVLEYFLGKNRSYLFLITKSNLSLHTLPPREDIRTSLAAYLVFLSRPPRSDWDWLKAARRLSSDLLGPVWEILPASITRLVVIPDDILCHLPFETLTLPPQEDNFIIKNYAVSYASSCSSLLFLKERKRENAFGRSLLAFGNPAYPSLAAGEKSRLTIAGIAKEMVEEQGFDLTQLEESKREIQVIARHFPRSERDIYLGEKASEKKVKNSRLEEYQVLHFACHGYLDEKVPFRSGLFLTLNQGGDEDGFLQASEIAGLKLSAELVVLSACRSSRGYLEKGEGVMGLTRMFFYSGARSVVSTLWKISDRAAAKFMKYFYDSLSRGEDKAEALRSAKLRLLESPYSHPFYWAAFVLHGEASTALRFR